MKEQVKGKIIKKDINDILEKIREKLARDIEQGCLFGDECRDDPCDTIYYIMPPSK